MYKPTRDMRDVRFFIKKKEGGFLVAGWIAKKGNEQHGDYVFVKNREEGEKIIKDLESQFYLYYQHIYENKDLP